MTTSAFANPFSNPTLDAMASMNPWAKEAEAMMTRLAASPKVAQAMAGAKKGATPYDVVMTDGPLRLLRYRGEGPRKFATPLLFVFALVNRSYVLDILAHKSVVRQFLSRGFDVYMIDWGVPTVADKGKTIDDYVNGDLRRVVDRVLALTGQEQLNILGYCMGGTLSAMYTSIHQEKVKNLIMLAAPVEWSQRDTLLSVWTDESVFDVDKVVDTFGLIPPEYLQASFALLRPVDNLIRKWIGFAERMEDEKFLEEFFAMETWVNDNVPLAGETYRDFVKYGFQRNLLVKGEFPVGGRKIDLGDITCPVLTLTADADHLVAPSQSTPFNDVVGSKDKSAMSLKAGHIGLAVGSKAHKDLWPKSVDWLAERSERN